MHRACVQFPALHEPGVAIHTCNPDTEEMKTDQKFKVIRNYIELKNLSCIPRTHMKMPGMVACTRNCSAWDTETG